MGNDLAGRTHARRQQVNGDGGKPEAGSVRGAELEPSATLASQIERMIPEYQKALPQGMEATQLVRDGITCLRTIDKLAMCDAPSVLGALMTCAQLGLRPAVLGHAWPMPFKDKSGEYHAQLIIGYQGYVELGYRSGKITAITARTRYEEDDFSLIFYQDRDELKHRPCETGLPGEPVSFYSTARLVGGGYTVTRPMSVESMRQFRDKHAPRTRNNELFGPWVNDFEAMAHKTMVKINFKLLPKSPEMATALEADEGIRVNLDPEADAAEVTSQPVNVVPGQVEREAPGQ